MVSGKLITLVVRNLPGLPFFCVFATTFLKVKPTQPAVIISAGGVGSPQRVVQPTLHQELPTLVQTNSVKISSLE